MITTTHNGINMRDIYINDSLLMKIVMIISPTILYLPLKNLFLNHKYLLDNWYLWIDCLHNNDC